MPPMVNRLIEPLTALSLAGDLGMGRGLEHSMRTAYLATRLAERLRLDDVQRTNTLYVSLLRGVGCVADAHDTAATVAGDEIGFKADAALVDEDDLRALLRLLARHAGRGGRRWSRPLAMARVIAAGSAAMADGLRAHCEVGDAVARRIGLPDEIRAGLLGLFERWDGRGVNRLAGEQIPLAARIQTVSYLADVFFTTAGPRAAVTALQSQSGRQCEPRLVDELVALGDDGEIWSELRDAQLRERLWELEPPAQRLGLDDERLDAIADALGDVSDLKSPFTVGHSRRVAELAVAAAPRLGMKHAELRRLRRAALLHDLGRMAISNAILDKRAALTAPEWETVRLHPYHTERILSGSRALADVAGLAAAHHERLDGSGYHRGSHASQLSPAERLLASADVASALMQERPHRPARSAEAAVQVLRGEAQAGRLDTTCVDTLRDVLLGRSSGVRAPSISLSDRELEVLAELARGSSTREAARSLGITSKTLRHHVEHIYDKLGVSTRPAAVVIALERGLLGWDRPTTS